MIHCKAMPASGAVYIEKGEKGAKEINREKVVSVIGSCWSMDQQNCTRIEKTYRLLVYGDTITVAERS
jgi:bisphosphoglycerate-independent phosphoglycerate mutase (AlkP superfamily)